MLTQLTGPVGDRVVVNTTAVELGLGTGGWHVVHWNLARDAWAEPGPGHIVKLRYTSLQVDTGAAEEAPAHADLPADLAERPVVACSLHSQLAGVGVAAGRATRPTDRLSDDRRRRPAMALSDLSTTCARPGVSCRRQGDRGARRRGDLEAVVGPVAMALGGPRAGRRRGSWWPGPG